MCSLQLTDKLPFTEVYLHAMVCDTWPVTRGPLPLPMCLSVSRVSLGEAQRLALAIGAWRLAIGFDDWRGWDWRLARLALAIALAPWSWRGWLWCLATRTMRIDYQFYFLSRRSKRTIEETMSAECLAASPPHTLPT